MLVISSCAFESSFFLQKNCVHCQSSGPETFKSDTSSETSRAALDKESEPFRLRLQVPRWRTRSLSKLLHAGLPVCIVGDIDVVINQVLGHFAVDSTLRAYCDFYIRQMECFLRLA